MTTTQLRPTRRTLVRGAAWSVPVISIAAAAPAFAASPCDLQAYKLDWGTTSYTPPPLTGSTRTSTASVTPVGATLGAALTVTFTSTTNGTVTRADDNLTVSTETDIGGLGTGERGINIAHAEGIVAGRGNRQDIAIKFDRAVTGLSFYITDIDSSRNNVGSNRNPVYEGWYDRVEFTGGPTYQLFGGVIGAGLNGAETTTAVGPWRLNDDDTNVPNTGNNQGNVKVTFAGTIAANTPITLTYWSTLGGGNQRIFLSDLSFSAKGC